MTFEDEFVFMLHRAIVYGTPLLLATVGEIYAERSGVLNLGVEGMMSIGAVVAFGVSLYTGNAWLGVMAAAAAAGALSLVHGFASINLRANQVVSGLALTMLGLGISGLLGKTYVGRPPGATIKGLEIPLLSEVPFLGKILFNQDPLVYASIGIAIVGWFVLFRTRLGLNIRSCGENPGAADVSGISVYRIRHLSVFLGGLLAGLAGAYLSLVYVPSWTQGLTGGRGWIVIGLTIFAFWKPLRAIAAAYLFGLLFVLPYRLQPLGVHTSLLQTLPYIVTVIALVLLSRESIRKRMAAPGALTTPYVREEI